MLKNNLRPFFILLIFFNADTTTAQLFPLKNYPLNYFEYPVVATKGLAANFGELRPNHYHMGLDCRTDQAQNKKILAAADGYIAKVKIEPWGFGRAIYINHPNGLTTLYAHLNDFYEGLEKYVKQQQYALQNWAVYLDIPANLFPVKKGDTIALSGNTGGSQGPHLHFEIRDTKSDKVLNPLLFGFGIADTVAPDIIRLAVYNRNLSTYEQTPTLIPIKKIKGICSIAPALITVNTDKVSFGISATDRVTGSSNRNGIYEAVLYNDDRPITGFQIDNISYDETRDFNAHIDYKVRSGGGPYIQHLSRLPGYNNSIYKSIHDDGIINLADDSIHTIKIEVKDVNGNVSTVLFSLRRDTNYVERVKIPLASQRQSNEFHPDFINVYENSDLSFYLSENKLYDSIRFQYSETIPKPGNTVYQLHNTSVPVHGYFPISIKAQTALPGKMVMHRFANGKHDYTKADAVMNGKETGWYKASFREFGSFELIIDTVAPVITPIGFKDGMNSSKQSRIVFVVKDNTEEVKFNAMLDGNWLRFSNDKGNRFIYDFDEMCPAGEHELKIVAEDQVGNVSERVYHFTR